MALKTSIGDDAAFKTAPKRSSSAAKPDIERHDRYDARGDVYTVMMQQQMHHPEHEARPQQMR